jgi:hypothetical protein
LTKIDTAILHLFQLLPADRKRRLLDGLHSEPASEKPHAVARVSPLMPIPSGAWRWRADTTGRVLHNDSGRTGWSWTAAIHPDDQTRFLVCWGKSLETGEPFACSFRLVAGDGTDVVALGHAAPELDEAGNVSGWVGFTVPCTAPASDRSIRKAGL